MPGNARSALYSEACFSCSCFVGCIGFGYREDVLYAGYSSVHGIQDLRIFLGVFAFQVIRVRGFRIQDLFLVEHRYAFP